jgi:hypothetical protein
MNWWLIKKLIIMQEQKAEPGVSDWHVGPTLLTHSPVLGYNKYTC